MERYVKFVISLLILLTLLSPIMKLFTSQTQKQIEMALSGDVYQEDGNIQAETKKILAQGQKLQQQREQEVLAWTGEEIAKQMREQLKNATGHNVSRVAVKLGVSSDTKETIISSVEVMVGAPIDQESEPTEDDKIKSIEIPAVKPVEIDVSIPSKEKQNAEAKNETQSADENTATSVMQPNDEQQKLITNKVKTFLQETWGLQKEVISVGVDQANLK